VTAGGRATFVFLCARVRPCEKWQVTGDHETEGTAAAAATTAVEGAADGATDGATEGGALCLGTQAATKSKVWDFLSNPLKDEIVAAGPQRGKRKLLYLCKVQSCGGFCGVEIMLTARALPYAALVILSDVTLHSRALQHAVLVLSSVAMSRSMRTRTPSRTSLTSSFVRFPAHAHRWLLTVRA
jgi:hypothetical protein